MEYVYRLATEVVPCGSRVTCNPPVLDTDEDYLVLVPAAAAVDLECVLMSEGWTLGGSAIPDESNTVDGDSRFKSWTRGSVNLIVTTSARFYRRFVAATEVCRRLNLLSKQDRIALFQAVLYANVYK